MKNRFDGRPGLVVGIVALVAALGGTAIALPGKNSVDSGDIKNGQVATKDMKIAYLRIEGDEDIVKAKGIVGTDKPIGNVLCLNLKFKPKTASASRTPDSGGDEPTRAAHVGIPPQAASLCDAPFTDGIVQVPGASGVGGTTATFWG